jgi:hypothetical protein
MLAQAAQHAVPADRHHTLVGLQLQVVLASNLTAAAAAAVEEKMPTSRQPQHTVPLTDTTRSFSCSCRLCSPATHSNMKQQQQQHRWRRQHRTLEQHAVPLTDTTLSLGCSCRLCSPATYSSMK